MDWVIDGVGRAKHNTHKCIRLEQRTHKSIKMSQWKMNPDIWKSSNWENKHLTKDELHILDVKFRFVHLELQISYGMQNHL